MTGKYRGFISALDPSRPMIIRATIPAVLGRDSKTKKWLETNWFGFCLPFPYVNIPLEIGMGVWIEFERGMKDAPIAVGFWTAEKADKAQLKQTEHVTKWKQEYVFSLRNGKNMYIRVDVVDKKVEFKVGDLLTGTVEANLVSLKDKNNNEIKLTGEGINIKDKSGNEVDMVQAALSVKGSTKVTVDAPVIDIGAATQLINNLPACLFTGAPHAVGNTKAKV